MEIKFYENILPDEAKYIREAVFVTEQGFKEEFDSTDNVSTHLVLFDGDKPAGTCRFFKGDSENEYLLGRLAVLKEYRGAHIGAQLVGYAEELARGKGACVMKLHSQVQARHFYEKQGYTAYGEVDFDEDCPHIWLQKAL